MGLNARIIAKLDAGIDAAVFERCAVALMAKQYEGVVGIEGGSDGGRDGDIIAPIADDPDSRGRVLVTTGDSLSNLRSSHKTWMKFWDAGDNFRVDQLVIVTSNSLSDTKRRNIETYCKTHTLPVPRIYGRQWLVESLRCDPDLRVELTGVRGRLEALTTKAPEPSSSTALFGRDQELEQLRRAVASKSDVTLTGLPGVGKSRMLAELEGSVHFVDRLARDDLMDDLFDMEPSVVVVDDAHLGSELLEQLVGIRSQEQLDFTIVAATWGGTESQVVSLLKDPVRVVIDRLPRPALDQMIQALGAKGVRARSLVLGQSDGRPGWAVLLSRLVVEGAGDDLATGQSLLDQVAGLTTDIAGNAVLNDALASIAALGAATLEDIEIISNHVGVPYADLIAWLEATAQGGLVDRTDDRWSVLAPLRTLIVASTFFGVRKRRRWDSFAEKFPRDERLDLAVLDVAVDIPDVEARALADAWFSEVSMRGSSEVPLDLVEIYSGIDEAAADRAALMASAALRATREPHILYGDVTFDPIGRAAEGILRAASRQACSREGVRGLLALAVGDDRPRHQHPEHPMRVIQDLAQYLDPDLGPLDDLRHRILRYSLEWFDEDPDGARWQVLAEVARYAFDPSVEGNWSDPGSHRKITLSRGVMTPRGMDSLLAFWEEIDVRIGGEPGQAITHHATAHICDIFDAWSTLAAGVTDSGISTASEHKAIGLRGAAMSLSTLRVLAERFPAIPIRVNKQLALVSMWNGGTLSLEELPVIDHRLAQFAGTSEPDDDIQLWMAGRREQQTSLARELDDLSPEEGVAEYQRLESEASIVLGSHEGASFSGVLADRVASPGAWLEAAIAARAYPLIAPLVARARADDADIGDLIRSVLGISELRPSILRAITQEENELDDLAHTVIDDLTHEDVPLIASPWVFESVTPMLRKLLVHKRAEVRSLAAVAFGEGGRAHGPALPNELRPVWRMAFIHANPSQLPRHLSWRLGEILKHAVTTDPELFTDWFIANAEVPWRFAQKRPLAESLADILCALPQDHKRRIVTTLGPETLISSGFAGNVLGTDANLANGLLIEGVVGTSSLLRSMSGYRDHTVETLAPVLAAAQVRPDRIVAHALKNRNWTGAESGAILKDLEFFTKLREQRPEIAEVCTLATERLSQELETAREKEEKDKRCGW